MGVAAIAQLVEYRDSNLKVSDSRFDSRTGDASLRPRESHLTFITH